eukprot:3294806-Pyramimonas_sp.AAC.1
MSLVAYNQIAVSVLMYIAQFFPPTADCCWQAHLGLQSLTCAPRRALSDHMLVGMKALGGKMSRARSLSHETRAAAYRATLASSVIFASIEKLEDAFEDPECHLDAHLHPVYTKSFVLMMAQNYRELSRIPSAPTVFETGLQKKMTKLVLSHNPLVPFPELILRRLQYWVSRFPEAGQVGAPEAQLCFSWLTLIGQ